MMIPRYMFFRSESDLPLSIPITTITFTFHSLPNPTQPPLGSHFSPFLLFLHSYKSRYTDQSALDTHFKCPQETQIITFLNSDPVILTPIVDTLIPRCSFTRTNELPDDPTIVYASIAYTSPGAREEALAGWMDVTRSTYANQERTLSYNILDDQDDYSSVKVLEIHESEEWLFEVHAKSEAVVKNRQRYGAMRQHVEHVRLRRAGGFLKR